MKTILRLQQVSKVYRSGNHDLKVLDEINFSVKEGSTMAIVGPSGSGKTTLLGLCAGLDRSSTGTVELHETLLNNLNELEDEIRTLKWQHQLLLAKIRIQKVFTGDKCGCSKKTFSSLENEVYCYQICWDNR